MNEKNLLALAIATIAGRRRADPAMAYTLLSPRRRWPTTPVVKSTPPATRRSTTATAA